MIKMSYDPEPLSKTAKYKKITKPLLERKRRARINRCLDELKDLMVGALEIDDDNLSKLEKADILELTVNHLTKLHSPKDPVLEAKKFQAGFGQCAAEACRFIMSIPDLDRRVSQNLVNHLSTLISTQPLTVQVPDRPYYSPPHSPSSTLSDRHHYYSDPDRSSSDPEDSLNGDGTYRHYPKYNNQTYKPLLQTVPRQHKMEELVENFPRRVAYTNKVPAEDKEAILKKIRQHIMDKRGHEDVDYGKIGAEIQIESKPFREDVAPNGLLFPYSVLNIPENIETLDLRKVRSPNKQSPEPKIEVAEKIGQMPCEELPQDYNNLPPKKKRKLIEYQEQMRQEEANKRLAYLQEQRENENRTESEENSKWRPW